MDKSVQRRDDLEVTMLSQKNTGRGDNDIVEDTSTLSPSDRDGSGFQNIG